MKMQSGGVIKIIILLKDTETTSVKCRIFINDELLQFFCNLKLSLQWIDY